MNEITFLHVNCRLTCLHETCSSGSHSVRFSDEKTYGRGGKKGDILKLVSINNNK